MTAISRAYNDASIDNIMYVVIIFSCITAISICTHNGYHRWSENNVSPQSFSNTSLVKIKANKHKWNLLSPEARNIDTASLMNEKKTSLKDILLSGIIYSQNKSASRVILQENGEQNIYSVNDVLKSASTIRVTDISKNQVFFSCDGSTQLLTLLPELTPPAQASVNGS